MNLREGIKQAILANTELLTILGDRVWSTFAPVTTSYTCWVVMTKIAGGEVESNQGDGGLTHPVFQFTIGGTDKVQCDRVQYLLEQFNAFEYTYAGEGGGHVLTFFYVDSRDGWDDRTRNYNPSVDLTVWAYKS